MVNKKLFFFLILAVFLSGCATVSTRDNLPTYSINGVTYISLVGLCQKRGINLEQDHFARTITLSRGQHKINLMAGESLAIVDGNPEYLRHKVNYYQGSIVIPYKFKEQIIDVLFGQEQAVAEKRFAITNIKKVIIDAGHGGYDPGAIGKSGVREKDINLDIALRLNKLLKDSGVEVVMTRSTDNFVSLERRVEIANRSKADIFISIHGNANRAKSLNGFEVYYISPNVSNARRAQVNADNAILDLDRSSYEHMTKNLRGILWDMIYTQSRAESVELAQDICRSVGRDLDTKVLGIKGAGFFVLKGASMPAVLVEVGFLSNREEERLLGNSYYRQQIAETIASGITNYAKDCSYAEAK